MVCMYLFLVIGSFEFDSLDRDFGAGKGFGPCTREKVWNSFSFGSICTKSIGNYKVSGRPPKGEAGGRAQVYDTRPTQEVAMPDLQT